MSKTTFLDYYRGVLTERQDYIGMFKSIIDNANAQSSTPQRPKMMQDAQDYVKWAQQILKKNDRIVWFLRLARLALASTYRISLDGKRGVTQGQVKAPNITQLKTQLTHFMSIPAPGIQQTVFSNQTPEQLIQSFKDIEAEWIGTANDDAGAEDMFNKKRLILASSDDVIALQCPDQYAWVDLERPSCRIEADAMGHCGNGGSRGSETILSLRKRVHFRGELWWYPVCTFILHPGGILGEMKGRNNDKPQEKYHPYILALLKSNFIHEIQGGGYLPEHNFALNDLDRDEREALLAQKPELGNAEDMYAKEGMTKRVLRLLYRDLEANDIPSPGEYDSANKRFIVGSWTDLESFAREDDEFNNVFQVAIGEADFQTDRGDVREEFFQTLSELPDDWQSKFIKRAGIKPSMSHDDNLRTAASRLAANNDEWYMTFEDIFNSQDRLREEAWERIPEYISSISFSCDYAYTNIPNTQDELQNFVADKKAVYLYVDERNMVELSCGDNQDDYDTYKIKQEGWEGFDYENTNERRQEEGLYSSDRKTRYKDAWLLGVKTDGDDELTNDYLTALNGNRTSRIVDPKQQELSFEESLNRFRKLAGLLG